MRTIMHFAYIFVECFHHLLKLLSFPTRRSSDLPSTYISPLSNSTPCIRKDRISSKSLMRLSICLWKPSIGRDSVFSYAEIGRAVQQECRDRPRMPSSA